MVNGLENLNKYFRKGSKNFEAAQLLLVGKSYDEVTKIIPDIHRKSLYNVRAKLRDLKDQGLLGNKKNVIDPPKEPDKVSEENRMKILNQLLLKKPNEQSREEIESIAKELSVKPEFLENLMKEKTKIEAAEKEDKTPLDKDGVNVTKEKKENPGNPAGVVRTDMISTNGSKLKVSDGGSSKVVVSTDTPPIQMESKELEVDSEEKLAKVIVGVLDERDRQIKAEEEEQMRITKEEDRKAFEIVAKKFNVKPENLPMLLNQQSRENMVKSVNDLPGRNVSDSQMLSRVMKSLPAEQIRLLLKDKTGTVENPMLAAFKYMDTEASLVDIMDELNLDFNRAIDLQTKYNQMKRLELERQQLDEPYLKAWFDIAKILGANMRRNCSYYKEISGICEFWKLSEISKQYRTTFRGLFRSGTKKDSSYYIYVNNHPEVCTLCAIGTLKMRGIETS